MKQNSFALLSLLAGLGRAQNYFNAFSDNQCTQALKLTGANFDDGMDHTGLEIRNSITDDFHANGAWYDDLSFPGANTSSSTGTQKKVYWSVPQPDRGCAFILMKTFDRSADHITVSKLNGEIIINAPKGGCYYSSLDDHTGMITTYCCGSGDCARADLGTGLIAKREAPLTVEAPKEERRAISPAARAADMVRRGETISIKTPSGTVKRATLVDRDDPAPPATCSVISTIAKNFKAVGQQMAITNVQSCGSGGGSETPCSFAAGQEKTFESAVSSESSFTLTTEEGISESIEADATFLGAGVKSTTELSFSMSQAWTTTTGTEVTDGKASSTENTLQQEPGTTAFLSFVPLYRCWSGRVHCSAANGNWVEGDQSFCVPGGPDGGKGYYGIVYTATGGIS